MQQKQFVNQKISPHSMPFALFDSFSELVGVLNAFLHLSRTHDTPKPCFFFKTLFVSVSTVFYSTCNARWWARLPVKPALGFNLKKDHTQRERPAMLRGGCDEASPTSRTLHSGKQLRLHLKAVTYSAPPSPCCTLRCSIPCPLLPEYQIGCTLLPRRGMSCELGGCLNYNRYTLQVFNLVVHTEG